MECDEQPLIINKIADLPVVGTVSQVDSESACAKLFMIQFGTISIYEE